MNRWTVIGVSTTLLIAGCGNDARTDRVRAEASASMSSMAPVPAAPITTTTTSMACHDAPAAIVAMINAAFTNGEHLANAQSVNMPKAMTLVGGDIVDADGSRASSRDAWLVSNGAVYAMTSDARRRTMFPDGRDVPRDWIPYNDGLADCVGRVDAATPG